MRFLPALLVLALAGCLRSTTYNCDNDSQCTGAGADSQCDLAVRACTFADSSCTSGRRYADHSGSYSNRCVGEIDIDSGNGNEMPGGEPPPMGCPADFMTLPDSGPRGHRYFLLPASATWAAQRNACSLTSPPTYMAFPDGATLADAQAELAALKTLAGDGAWVGINDITVEGMYRRSTDNGPISAITNMLLMPSGNPGQRDQRDCIYIKDTVLDNEQCDQQKRAVCECVP